MDKSSGVGVVDKTVALLDLIARGPASLADLVDGTGIARPTAHRLATALERLEVLDRDESGRFRIGPRAVHWASATDILRVRAEQAVIELRDLTGASAQVYRRIGEQRLCVAAAEPTSGLRDTVPVGALLTMSAGSAAQVLVAWLDDRQRERFLVGAAYSADDLGRVRQRGWAHSLAQREPGVASLSVPVWGPDGSVVAAVSISGPVERLARPTSAQRRALEDVAGDIAAGLGGSTLPDS